MEVRWFLSRWSGYAPRKSYIRGNVNREWVDVLAQQKKSNKSGPWLTRQLTTSRLPSRVASFRKYIGSKLEPGCESERTAATYTSAA
jgi:hypothetical protein